MDADFEMFFYLLFAMGLALRVNLYAWIGGVLSVVACLFFARPATPSAAWFLADPIVLEFLFGMIVGGIVLAGRRLPPALAAPLVVIGLALTYAWPGALDSVPYVLSGGFVDAMILWSAVSLEPVLKNHIPRWLVFLGSASYATYLFHPLCAPIAPTILKRLHLPYPFLSVAGSVATALIAGSLILRYVEPVLTRWARSIPGVTPHTHRPMAERDAVAQSVSGSPRDSVLQAPAG